MGGGPYEDARGEGEEGGGGSGWYEAFGGFDEQDGPARGYPDYVEHSGDQGDRGDPVVRRRRSVRVLGIGTALVVLLAGAYAAVAESGHGDSGGPAASDAPVGGSVPYSAPSTVSAQDTAAVQQTAQAFLTAWQSGDDSAAAALTDSPQQAKAALDAYRSDLHVSPLVTQLTGTDGSDAVTFTVAATVHLRAGSAGTGSAAASGTWQYGSQLSVYRTDGKWLVQWEPDILAANMASDTHLTLAALPASSAGQPTVTDDHGDDLADSSESALQKIAAQLSQSGPSGTGGTPGIEVEVVADSGGPLDGVLPAVVTQPGSSVLATTIDAKVQKAASAAVQDNQNSSMVVLQPTTGHILAIANNDGGLDNALTTKIAPGSTMKVVTGTAMLNHGMSMDSDVACPASLDVAGAVTHNSGGESRPSDTPLIDDFAVSCNNAFAEQYQLLSGDLLERTAQSYFGLDEPWDIGLGQPTTYFTIPTGQSDAEVAAEAFGQGKLEASPLAMASVAATVDTGTFHQPVILASAEQVSATPLPSSTDSQLKHMMRAVVTYSDGTGHGIGFGSGVYAKTGTAEDQPGYEPNSWIVVYDPSLNIAIGCVVLDAGAGNEFAGPEALSVIKALS